MSIWRAAITPERLQERVEATLVGHLGIRISEIGPDYLRATMPVDHRTRQFMGLLHGGASAALAETVGGLAGCLCVDPETRVCVGQEITANHLRPAASGVLTATARPLHLGARSQVWQIDVCDDQGRLVCVSRLTSAVIEGPGNPALPQEQP